MLKLVDGKNSITDYKALYSQIVNDEDIVVVKNFFEASFLSRVREGVYEFFKSQPERVEIDYANSDKFRYSNFWKFERGVSNHQKSLHSFNSYFINKLDELPSDLAESVKFIKDEMAALYLNLVVNPSISSANFRPQLIQYHRGGGFFSAHIHPFNPMQIGVVLAMSEIGVDYEVGGGGFENTNGDVIDTSFQHNIGDICLFKYSLRHWVLPCDQDLNLRDDSSGRWSFVIPIY